METGHPVAEILIKYNSNNLDENNEEEKEFINIEFTEEMANFIESLHNKLMREFSKK